jgi:biotin carboxyl carrier protein
MKQFKFTINDTLYQVTVNKIENTVAEVEVNGISYKVLMDKPVTKQVVTYKRPAQALTTEPTVKELTRPVGSASSYVVRAPLPGMILSIVCQVGDKVKKGQNLLILEAMKMENSIPADHDGTVSAIKVKQGESVMENADLVIIHY